MWLCTKLGFYSIVEKLPDEIHVRARAKRDLQNLKSAVGAQFGSAPRRWKIHTTKPADYRFRIVINRASLKCVMETLALNLDYSNFKGVIGRTPDQADKLPTYTKFHHDMEHLQNFRPKKRPPEPLIWAYEDASIDTPIDRL